MSTDSIDSVPSYELGLVIRYVIATFSNAGGSCSNSVQHNTVHRNLVPRPSAPKDPCLPQVPPRFPGLLHLCHQRFVFDWRLHIYSPIKVDEMGKHNITNCMVSLVQPKNL